MIPAALTEAAGKERLMRQRTRNVAFAAGLALATGAGFATTASAQTQSEATRVLSRIPQRDTLLKLTRPVTLEVEDHRLEDVIRFITTVTGADIEPMWISDRNPDGLDKDAPVTLKLPALPALTVIERVLTYVEDDFSGGNTWQMSEDTGAIQLGPRVRLNRYKRTVTYDINDMLMEIPDRDQFPDIDLQNVLQSNQGGGGGQSPFRDDQQDDNEPRPTLEDRAKEIEDLLTEFVEPEQWQRNGGEGAIMKHFRGVLIIRAADYIHREINGYPYWPAGVRISRGPDGSRWVSLNMDTGISTIHGMAKEPVSAVVGGEIIRSGPGGGG
jgi:hypothetical protein